MPRPTDTARAAARAVAAAPPSTTDHIGINIDDFTRHLTAEGRSPKTRLIYSEAARRVETYLRANGVPLAVANITREHIEASSPPSKPTA